MEEIFAFYGENNIIVDKSITLESLKKRNIE